MNWSIALVKALKSAGFVFLGSVVAALLTPDFQSALRDIGTQLANNIPVVGNLLGPVIASSLVAALTALSVALDNWRKHWSDPVI